MFTKTVTQDAWLDSQINEETPYLWTGDSRHGQAFGKARYWSNGMSNVSTQPTCCHTL
jgi:hypothetical protein